MLVPNYVIGLVRRDIQLVMYSVGALAITAGLSAFAFGRICDFNMYTIKSSILNFMRIFKCLIGKNLSFS